MPYRGEGWFCLCSGVEVVLIVALVSCGIAGLFGSYLTARTL